MISHVETSFLVHSGVSSAEVPWTLDSSIRWRIFLSFVCLFLPRASRVDSFGKRWWRWPSVCMWRFASPSGLLCAPFCTMIRAGKKDICGNLPLVLGGGVVLTSVSARWSPNTQRWHLQLEATRAAPSNRAWGLVAHSMKKKSSSNGCRRGRVRGVVLESTLAQATPPTSALTKIPPHLRRLFLPLPLSQDTCSCGRPIDSFGHQGASCTRIRVLHFRVQWHAVCS